MTNRTLAEIDEEIARTKNELANVKGSETEVYARIVGYYRSVRNWNKGKRDEYNHRKMFVYGDEIAAKAQETAKAVVSDTVSEPAPVLSGSPVRYELFYRTTCPNCPAVKEYISHVSIPGTAFDVDSEEGFNRASVLGIMAAPTVVLFNEFDAEIGRAHSVDELIPFFETEPALC